MQDKQNDRCQNVILVIAGVCGSILFMYLGYIIAAVIGYVQDNSTDALTGVCVILKSPFSSYFNRYTPITMILGFIAFEGIFFLFVIRGRKKDNEGEVLVDPEVIDLAEKSFEKDKDNDRNVLTSDKMFEGVQSYSRDERELNEALYISPEEAERTDFPDRQSVAMESNNKGDSQGMGAVSFSDEVVTDLLNDYDLAQIKAMLPLKEHISAVNATLLRRMFKPTMSADEISDYIKIFYE